VTLRADHRFWYHSALPFVEARWVRQGHGVCYAPHSHSTVSVGLINAGQSSYCNGRQRQRIGRGTAVLMNPEEVHACNPLGDQPWSYLMLYLDPAWVAGFQQGAGHPAEFAPFSDILSIDRQVITLLSQLQALLMQPVNDDLLVLESHLVELFSVLVARLQPQLCPAPGKTSALSCPNALSRAADYIADCWDEKVSLDDLCAVSGFSSSHLIRSFKARYGMTPHAYLNNHRIDRAKGLLRCGHPIAETAVAAGFVDQAHFQRVFKRLTATTPGTYLAS
jgi:AraC-like DNA-binding protein